MPYCLVITLPIPIALEVRMLKLKTSSHFNKCMLEIYINLYRQHRHSWKFWKAFSDWFKIMHYEEAMLQAQVNELVTELNATPYARIIG